MDLSKDTAEESTWHKWVKTEACNTDQGYGVEVQRISLQQML